MSAARDRHPSRYRPPVRVLGPIPEGAVLDGIAAEELPDLFAGVEYLLGLTGQFQQNEIARAPWREPV